MMTVYDVMAASDHQTFEINCDHKPVDAERCAPTSQCSIRPVWGELQNRSDGFLRGATIADLRQPEQRGQAMVTLGTGCPVVPARRLDRLAVPLRPATAALCPAPDPARLWRGRAAAAGRIAGAADRGGRTGFAGCAVPGRGRGWHHRPDR